MPLNMRNSTQIRFHCAGALVLAPQVQTNPSDQSITHSLTRALVASLRLLAHPKNKSHTHLTSALATIHQPHRRHRRRQPFGPAGKLLVNVWLAAPTYTHQPQSKSHLFACVKPGVRPSSSIMIYLCCGRLAPFGTAKIHTGTSRSSSTSKSLALCVCVCV